MEERISTYPLDIIKMSQSPLRTKLKMIESTSLDAIRLLEDILRTQSKSWRVASGHNYMFKGTSWTSLVSQPNLIPQHRSPTVSASDRCCGTRLSWLARLLLDTAPSPPPWTLLMLFHRGVSLLPGIDQYIHIITLLV